MSFYEELRRRNVVRAGIAYAVIAWLLAQVAEFALELTPEGVKREMRYSAAC